MKVLLVVPSLKKTGVTEVIKSLILENSSTEDGIEYFLLSLKDANGNNEFSKLLGKNLYQLPGKRILSLRKIHRFVKIVNSINPDIVHFNAFEADIYSLFLSSKSHRMISTAHNVGEEDFESSYGKIVGFAMAKVQVKLFSRLKEVIAVSHTVEKHYKKKVRCGITTILNGVNTRDKWRNKLTLKERYLDKLSRPIGMYSGNLSSRKNVESLFETFKRINSSECVSSLLVVGDDPKNPNSVSEYKTKYTKYGIKFLGRVDNVYPFLSIADYWVSASKSEGLPMAAIEAMSQNVDLILSDIPQHRELKINEKQNILFFKNNVDDLTDCLKRYVDLWKINHVSNNKYYFDGYFSSKKMYQKYIDEYHKLMLC